MRTTTTGTLAHSKNHTSATVIRLPGAAAQEVIQPKRRGRLPKIVTRLQKHRNQKAAQELSNQRQHLDANARGCAEVAELMRILANMGRHGTLAGVTVHGTQTCVKTGERNPQIWQAGLHRQTKP